ncbi:MAG: MBL fold metallo-hydrolase [Verrucomicrobia bacterium]|nr:MBL fold metallo-hydrolase [Verrucomicrobiota bacterium]
MSALTIQYHPGGVQLPRLQAWLDSRRAQPVGQRVFVSHAHTDHLGRHREVILSTGTARLMRARLGGKRHEHVLPFSEPRTFEGPTMKYEVTLLPAGHVLGSAMAWIRAGDETLLYTGDFRLRPGLAVEHCEPRSADTLIMETTFGRPEYLFPPTEEVVAAIRRFCRDALAHNATPVLFAYSLGKSQELLQHLGRAEFPVMLGEQAYALTRVYEQLGQSFPPYQKFDDARVSGHVVIGAPQGDRSDLLARLGRARTAIVSGWGLDPGCRYRYQTDAAFPLSDHADFDELLEFVRRVAPKTVYTLHGFAADFAQTLRERGVDARALSEPDQLGLPLIW